MHPLISIVIPVWNVEKYVEECLRAIQCQTYSHYEAMIINDGSTDGSIAVCERFCGEDSRFHLHHYDNGGLSEARNRGTKLAKGEYITYVDADDWIDPSFLTKLYELSTQYDCLCTGCNHSIVWDHQKKPRFTPQNRHEFLTVEQCMENILYHRAPDVSACGKLYHRSMIPALSFPKGRLFEDTATIVTRLQASGGIAMTYEPLYFYRETPNSISKANYTDRNWELMDAVEKINRQALSICPHLKKGTVRRKVHAALSIRRLLAHCGEENKAARKKANGIVRQNAGTVLLDPKAPMRDKAAIVLLLMGNAAFDFAWTKAQRRREKP